MCSPTYERSQPFSLGSSPRFSKSALRSSSRSRTNPAIASKRGDVTIDVLAPDNLGARADLRTVGSLTTVAIAGGSYALERSQPLAVRLDGRDATIPCPDLAGALVIKAAAAGSDHGLGHNATSATWRCSSPW
jgi:hypothetical protein